MRLRAAALALAVLCASVPASAATDMIGLYTDLSASSCSAPLTPYQAVTVYVMATLDRLDAVSAAEFSLDGYPGNPGYPLGQCTAVWESPLTIGDLDDDFTLAFLGDAVSGSPVLLGTLEFLAYSENWVDGDHRMTVVRGAEKQNIVLVDGDYEEHDVLGGEFTFNCSGTCNCGLGGAEAASISEIKGRY
ncbi:MAG: hypothetical protein R3C71_01330 [Candidatus Krumholzibacteriia bacterium]